ncbi:putative aldouronate transport system permease protein [Arthrobacter stackebrandtii]|uniref:Aldouronate transport system permease protein n=1 Tax=Arthrobacter stackebrandtii TaxID=272161 RepID=A0ABS4YSP2_9MICC|nr:carbohydrate ABC transporter permease [Arthrobacter stackebrandtii]MBP2411417.1 putative aldouronate transport system permease protein [Arthrobacter stackebrandtii]PYH00297.1 ABC transporter permease [Arthrobacter stackebrandtii]
MATTLTSSRKAARRAAGLTFDSGRPAWKEPASPLYSTIKAIIIGAITLTIVIPILLVVSTSLADDKQLIAAGGYVLWPTNPTFAAYEAIFSGEFMFRALGVSAVITAVGTFLALFTTITMAYATSRPVLFGRPVLLLVLFTLLFAPGLIPMFLMVKQLGLLNTLWSLILPSVFAAFNFVVMRSFFMNIPTELIEAARIDGASDFMILRKVVLPLSKAVIAVVGLFYAVGFWNAFFNAMLYINDQTLYPVQLVLRNYVVQGGSMAEAIGVATNPPPQSMQMAIVVVALVPILVVYPFLQKHFNKGVITGAVKG